MTTAVVVVCHNSDDTQLRATLSTLEKSTKRNLPIYIASARAEDVPTDQSATWLKVSSSSFEDILAEILPILTEFEWLWLLAAGQIPETDALSELLKVAETSATAAQIAPKLTAEDNPRIIQHFGLTLTPRSSLFETVRNELDQGQHDTKQDALGACLEGSIVSPSKLLAAGGAATTLSNRAADLELGIRLRLRGQRVLLAWSAKVRTPESKRESNRAIDFQLKLFYYSFAKSFFFWLLLPLLVTIEALWLMLRKQPERIPAELAAGFRVFFTAAKIWLGRKSLSRRERRNLRSLRSLVATRSMVKNARIQQSYADSDGATTASAVLTEKTLDLFSSGAIWVALALPLANLKHWPTMLDVRGAALLPMGDSWLNIFTATGSGFQNIGTGFFAPSDPFNWILLALASLTFWAPGLSIALLIFAANSLAFVAGFKALTLVTNKTWLAIGAALTYALWPSFLVAQNEARIPQLIAHILIPVAVFSTAKVCSKVRLSRQSTWGYTALAALAAAALGVSAPVLAPLMLLTWLVLMVANLRKTPYLIWMMVPLAVLWLPTIWYRVFSLGEPYSLLADPGLPLSSRMLDAFGLLTASWASEWQAFSIAFVGLAVLLATVALGLKFATRAYVLWAIALVALAGAWLFQQVRFVGNSVVGQTGEVWVNGSPHALLSVVAISLAFLISLALNELKWARAAGFVLYPAIAAAAIFAFTLNTTVTPTEGRVVPALVRAEAKQLSALKLLVLQPENENRFSATLVSSDGIHYSDLNTSYRFALADQAFDEAATVAAKLVSATTDDVSQQLSSQNIGYVLVPESKNSGALVSNIDSVQGLNSIGDTEFGQLWRVSGITDLPTSEPTNQDFWSVTKGLQLTVLLLFALLALPNRRREPQVAESDSFTPDEGESDV